MDLAISTATAACSVALIDGDRIVAEQHDIVGRGHAERLLPMIAALPDRGRADSILIDCGPGSFTGVRVGLAAAKALALAWNIPLFGFSTLALIAASLIDGDDTPLGVAIQGGHGELFVQRFSRAPLAPAGDLGSFAPAVAAIVVPDALVIGSAAAQLVAARGSGTAREQLPRAADVRLLPAALRTLSPTPIYGRAPDAKPQ